MYRLSFILKVLLLISCSSTHLVFAEQTSEALVPLSSFSRLPAYTDLDLSPKGSRIAYIQNIITPKKVSLLRTFDFKSRETKLIFSSDNANTKVKWVEWINEDILLISAIIEIEEATLKYYATRLFVADVSKKELELKPLLKQRNLGRKRFSDQIGIPTDHISQFQDSVIDFLPDDPEHILIEVDYDVQLQPSVFKVNVYTTKRKRLEKGKRLIRSWMTDQQHVIRLGKAIDYDTGKITYLIRDNKKSKFETLFTYTTFDEQPIQVVGFDLEPNILYYTQYLNDKRALFKMNLTDKSSELVLAHGNYDVTGRLIYDKTSKKVIGVYDPHSEFGRHFFDPQDASFYRAIDSAFADTNNYLIDMTDDEQIYIAYTESSNLPGAYVYGDRKKGTVFYLFYQYPELNEVELPVHEKIVYTTRDKLDIEAYLTLPVHGKAPYPLIVHPHGGPGARDYDGFDPWVAYLVNRGYAVLRPNFRGSSGYGWEFAQAQMGRWGLEMQDDITDGVYHLIDKKLVDKNKMCIFGASYGGYAAAMATVKTPDLFKCAISFAGVSDLRLLARKNKKFVGGSLVNENQLGEERKDLDARSPMRNVDKIKTPILLIHGEDDIVVPVNQSRWFADRLREKNRPHKYVELPNGDHYLSIQNNRDVFFQEIDAFIQEHIGH